MTDIQTQYILALPAQDLRSRLHRALVRRGSRADRLTRAHWRERGDWQVCDCQGLRASIGWHGGAHEHGDSELQRGGRPTGTSRRRDSRG